MSSIVKKSSGLSALKAAIQTDARVNSGEVARAIASESLVIAIDCSGSMYDFATIGEPLKKSEAAMASGRTSAQHRLGLPKFFILR